MRDRKTQKPGVFGCRSRKRAATSFLLRKKRCCDSVSCSIQQHCKTTSGVESLSVVPSKGPEIVLELILIDPLQKRGLPALSMSTRASESPSLPPGWHAGQAALGGVDLRLEARQRRGLAVCVAVLAVIAGWRTFVNWQIAPGGSVAPWLGITVALGLLAAWCAFADEVWHIERNHLVHRVGMGPWARSRHFRDADLQITLRFSTKFNVPYYRLLAIENGESHFLLERGEQELRQLANFISFHTGWPIRPLAPSPRGIAPL